MDVKQWGTPAANDANKTPHCEVNSKQAGLAKSVGLELERQWPTICAGDYRTPPTNSGLNGQTIMPSSEHALPKAAGGKLNPRWVETLMGLPVGWTMPSCQSPVTIGQTNCACSATELSRPAQNERSELSLPDSTK
jgi:hypothetical protein